MKGKLLTLLLIGLAVGLLAGCASQQRPVGTKPMGPWPNVPCPPRSPSWTAGERLDVIQVWALSDGENDVADLARDCYWDHVTGANHQAPALVQSRQIYKAWLIAWEAFILPANDPQKPDLWASCREELEHDP